MDLLKLAFIILLALVFLDYTKRVGDINFAIDASLYRYAEMLMQLVKGKQHFLRYKSGI